MEQTSNNKQLKKMEEHERIELRSDDVQEIIGTPPRWIVRWGTFIICTALAALIGVSFYVEYPDTVIGEVKLTSLTAPARINIPRNGNIKELLVKNGDMVKQGELLVVIQDAAHYQDVIDLEDQILPFRNASRSRLRSASIEPEEFELGNLQAFYSEFLTMFQQYQHNEILAGDRKLIEKFYQEIQQNKNKIKILERQEQLAIQQVSMAETAYNNHKNMFEDGGTVPKKDVDAKFNDLVNARQNVQRIEEEIGSTHISISGINSRIEEVKNNGSNNSNQYFTKVQESINKLLGAIDTWKQDFLLEAPIDGKVTMPENWAENSYLKIGTEIMAIVTSESSDDKFIQFLIPIHGSGKVKPDQKVILKFNNFPYKEYGSVRAKVLSIDDLPRDGKLQVDIALTKGLTAMKGKELPFSQEMQGIGEIITEKRSVFTRIFENVIEPFRKDPE